MTQQSGATPASDNPEQPSRSQEAKAASTTGQALTPAPPAKPEKRAKNLYEPYDTPPLIWVMLRSVARFLYVLKLRVRLVGLENVPKEGAYILASNHLSWMDVPLVPSYLKRKVVYMAKEELFEGKGGWIVRFFGAFPVKRGEADRQSLRVAENQLKAGKVFIIFPEGTRSKTHRLAKGHVGLGMIALRSGVPVIPVAIWGSEKALKAFRPRVNIVFGEPMILIPKGNKITREDIEEATAKVMRAIAAMMPPEYRGMYGDDSAPSSDESAD